MHDEDFDSPIRQQKQALRQVLRAQRTALSPKSDSPAAQTAGEAVAAHLLEQVFFSENHCVAVYAAVRGELPVSPLAALLARRGSAVCYPRILPDGTLAFHLVREPSELYAGVHGIPAPRGEAPQASSVDVFIVPGLGFDRHGYRLGFGRGHYDGALSARPTALRVGVGYDWQLVPRIPHEPHDQPVDLVVTPLGCVVTGARAVHSLCRISPKQEERT